jgi:hypothetical protein
MSFVKTLFSELYLYCNWWRNIILNLFEGKYKEKKEKKKNFKTFLIVVIIDAMKWRP